jgi:hypothetical protein
MLHLFYLHNIADFFSHCRYMTACLSRQIVPPVTAPFVDHRYFYNYEDGKGDYACGLARDAVAVELRANGWDFADTDFLKSLPNCINNPSVAGFMMEQAILSSIQSNGLAVGGLIKKPMTLVMFDGKFPKFKTGITNTPMLYCPRQFNFRGIDGIIVLISKPEEKRLKQKLSMFPLQITLAPDTHSDSHKAFFNEYKMWTEGLRGFDVVPEFAWITPNRPSITFHPETPDWPEHSERHVHLADVSQDIWNQYEKAKIMIHGASGEYAGVEERGEFEEPEGPGEQARPDGPSTAAGLGEGKTKESRGRGCGESGSGSGGMGGIGCGDKKKDYQSMTVIQLRQQLRSYMLPVTGKKGDLINRLMEDDRKWGAT